MGKVICFYLNSNKIKFINPCEKNPVKINKALIEGKTLCDKIRKEKIKSYQNITKCYTPTPPQGQETKCSFNRAGRNDLTRW